MLHTIAFLCCVHALYVVVVLLSYIFASL